MRLSGNMHALTKCLVKKLKICVMINYLRKFPFFPVMWQDYHIIVAITRLESAIRNSL